MISKKISQKPGVYLMKDTKGSVLYVGKAKNLKKRIEQYERKQDSRAMIPFLMEKITDIETIVTFTEKEALILESSLVKKHKPKYNVLLKDDKSFISLYLNTKHLYPRLEIIRYRDAQKISGLHFGPFTSALSARRIFDMVQRLFPLRECSDRELRSRKRSCILYSMHRCIAPCVQKCTQEQYQVVLDQVVDFLQGKYEKVCKKIRQEIEVASSKLLYEKAANLLKILREIEALKPEKDISVTTKLSDCDVFHYVQKTHYLLIVKLQFRKKSLVGSEHFTIKKTFGFLEEIFSSFLRQHYEKKTAPSQILLPISLPDAKLLQEIIQAKIRVPQRGDAINLLRLAEENAKVLYEEEMKSADSLENTLLSLQEVCSLNRFPAHIECIDISNLSHTQVTASVVVYIDGLRDKKRSRHYRIQLNPNSDEYSALKEVLTRRLIRTKKEDCMPDLMIIDGGKGQLSLALKVFQELNITNVDVLALTKDQALHTKGLTHEKIFLKDQKEPLLLDVKSPVLFFLQRVRDEAHRRAINLHRKRRDKKSLESILDQVPGIGPQKKKNLLLAFGSVQGIFQATDKEILSVQGISGKDLQSLKDYRKPNHL